MYLQGLDFYVDGMDNAFEHKYASWPFRFWVLNQTKVLFKAMPKGAKYDLQTLDQFLDATRIGKSAHDNTTR